ncbi:hypothetical protein TRVL_06737 [Trypanosoma vivax]|nr:hypothetical protein TRVL_06737 [Trypanosoma vivax]
MGLGERVSHRRGDRGLEGVEREVARARGRALKRAAPKRSVSAQLDENESAEASGGMSAEEKDREQKSCNQGRGCTWRRRAQRQCAARGGGKVASGQFAWRLRTAASEERREGQATSAERTQGV